MVFIFLFLTYLLCIIGPRFIHLIRTDSKAFLFTAKYYSIEYMHHNLFIHSSVVGRLSCLHVLGIANSAAVNAGVHVSFRIMFSPDTCPGVGLDHMAAPLLVS